MSCRHCGSYHSFNETAHLLVLVNDYPWQLSVPLS